MRSVKLATLAAAAAVLLPCLANAQVTADLIAYGKACGKIQIIPTNPLIGKDFKITTKSSDATTGLLAIGLTRANFPVGGGCTLYVNPILVGPWFSKTRGTSTLTFRIPKDTALLKLKFTIQTTALNSSGMAWSRGIEGKIGDKEPEE